MYTNAVLPTFGDFLLAETWVTSLNAGAPKTRFGKLPEGRDFVHWSGLLFIHSMRISRIVETGLIVVQTILVNTTLWSPGGFS